MSSWFAGIDVVTRNSAGEITPLGAESVNCRLVGGSDIAESPFTTNAEGFLAGDEVSSAVGAELEFYSATKTGKLRLFTYATQAEAWSSQVTLILDDAFATTKDAPLAEIYLKDTDEPTVPPTHLGTQARGTTVKYAVESAYTKNLDVFALARTLDGQFAVANFVDAPSDSIAPPSTRPADEIEIGVTDVIAGGANRLLFDDAGTLGALIIGSGLSISGGTTLTATGSGLTIGSTTISSGTNNRLLYQSSGVVQQSGNLTYDGSTLTVQAVNSSQTADIFAAKRYDGATALRVDDDTSVTLGGSYDYANAKHAAQHICQYAAGGSYSGKGFKINDLSSGAIVRLHAISGNALFITNDSGSAAALTLGTRVNPGDASTFIASTGRWIINSGSFVVNNAAWSGNAQIESYSTSRPQYRAFYDGSNYASMSVASNGATTLDAVGSGAKWIFADAIEPASIADSSAPNNSIYYSTTASKLVYKDSGGTVNVLY